MVEVGWPVYVDQNIQKADGTLQMVNKSDKKAKLQNNEGGTEEVR